MEENKKKKGMKREELLAMVDHTLLAQTATWNEIRRICEEGQAFHTASVCIPPNFVRQAAEFLEGSVPICTVVGFPNGYSEPEIKEGEARLALEQGAQEIDMVISIGRLKEGRFDLVADEIRRLKDACGSHILKVIVETCLLTEEEKKQMCRTVTEAGADYIKTSTGFSSGGATFEDVALFQKYIGPGVKIKAAGGIRSFEDGERFVQLGASRLGTSRLVGIMKEEGYGE